MARKLGLFLMWTTSWLVSPAQAGTEDELRQRDDTIAELVRKVDVLTEEVSDLRTQVVVPEEEELKSIYGYGPAASRVYGMSPRALDRRLRRSQLLQRARRERRRRSRPRRRAPHRALLRIQVQREHRVQLRDRVRARHHRGSQQRRGGRLGLGRVRGARLPVEARAERARRAAADPDGLPERGPRAALLLRRASARGRARHPAQHLARERRRGVRQPRRDGRVPRVSGERLLRAELRRRWHPRRPAERQTRHWPRTSGSRRASTGRPTWSRACCSAAPSTSATRARTRTTRPPASSCPTRVSRSSRATRSFGEGPSTRAGSSPGRTSRTRKT